MTGSVIAIGAGIALICALGAGIGTSGKHTAFHSAKSRK